MPLPGTALVSLPFALAHKAGNSTFAVYVILNIEFCCASSDSCLQ